MERRRWSSLVAKEKKKTFPKFLAIQLANFIEQFFSLLSFNLTTIFRISFSRTIPPTIVNDILSKKKKKREKRTKLRNIYTRWITRDHVYPCIAKIPRFYIETTLQQSSILFCRRSEPTTALRVATTPCCPDCLISALFHWRNKEEREETLPRVIMHICTERGNNTCSPMYV